MTELARIQPVELELVEERRTDTDSWIRVVADVSKLAQYIAETDFVPKGLRGSAPATAAAILYGREVGLPPMTALTQVNVIEGRPSLAAEGMRALVLAAGHELVFAETTGAICTMRARRAGSQEWTALTWNLDMARSAGLLPGKEKSAWRTYPRAMLQARCTTELCRMVFPDVIHGFRSVEEMEDSPETLTGVAETGTGGSSGTTTVQRTTGAKKAAGGQRRSGGKVREPATAAHAAGSPEQTGPPLPGEPGYDTPPTQRDQPAQIGGAGGPGDAGSAAAEPAVVPAPIIEGRAASDAAPTPEGSSLDADDGGEEDPSSSSPSPDGEPEPDQAELGGLPPSRAVTRPQLRFIFQFFGKVGLGNREADREERLRLTSLIIGREVDSSADLTLAEAQKVIDTLALAGTSLEELHRILDATAGTPPLFTDDEETSP